MKYLHIILVLISCLVISCQDLKIGDDFLAKPPSSDLTIDDIYSNAEYARRALWAAYSTLPYGVNAGGRSKLGTDILECLTDLNHSNLNWGNSASVIYYNGTVTADLENTGNGTKYSFLGNSGEQNWLGIRRGWLFIANVDAVPDMDEAEKKRLKAEAKVIIAIHYSDMFRHFGGLPWIDHAFLPTDDFLKERETALQTMDNIVTLLDEAAADLPWILTSEDTPNWDGRMTRAAALGLKARILLFGASPLFNSATPYMQGEASDKLLVWHGGYKPELWERARKAHEDFFSEMQQRGGYKLVDDLADLRLRWRKAYWERNNGECLVSTRVCYTAPQFWDSNYYFMQSAGDYGAAGPTQELVDMFPMTSGLSINEDPSYDPRHPYNNRDPRLYETLVTNGDTYYYRTCEVYVGGKDNQSNAAYGPWKTGYRLRKFLLDGGGAVQYEWPAQMSGLVVHWPYLRLPELYLGYAEAIAQTSGDMNLAYSYIDALRSRVGVGGMKRGLTGQEFIEAVLTERAIELAFEEVRWFDMVRYKREDLFKKQLHMVELTKVNPDDTNPTEFNYNYKEIILRYWARDWSPKWYLSAFPSNEINKRYGLIQNPGW